MRTHAEITSLADAVNDLVNDGDTVALEGFTHLIPVAAGQEIIRQRKRDLTLVRMTPDIVYDQLIGAGCARKLIFSWGGNPGVGSLHRFRAAVQTPRAGDRGAQPRGHGQPLRRRRFAPAVRDPARLQRHVAARAHGHDQVDHVPVHRRAAHRRARARPRRRHHPRPAGRPPGQRPALGPGRRAEGDRARRQAQPRDRRGDRRRADAAAVQRRPAALGRRPRRARPGRGEAVLRAGLLRARQPGLPRLGRRPQGQGPASPRGWRRS